MNHHATAFLYGVLIGLCLGIPLIAIVGTWQGLTDVPKGSENAETLPHFRAKKPRSIYPFHLDKTR